MKTYSVITGAALAGLMLAAAPTLADPVAPYPPLSKLGKQLVAAQQGKNANKVKACPDAAVVAMPVYPHSYCVSHMSSSSNGKKDPLEVLVLVSKHSPHDVRSWYGKHLKGWNYHPKFHNFAPPNWSIQTIFKVPQVEIKKATKMGLALYGIAYDLRGMQTIIDLYYHPQKK